MLRNYLKIGIRNLFKHKGLSAIKILGLAIGVGACLIILQYTSFEKSYDQFHRDANRIYRVETDYIRGGQLIYDAATTFAVVGQTLKDDFTEIEDFVKLYPASEESNIVVQNEAGEHYREGQVFYVTQSFFDFFSVPLKSGNATLVLDQPNQVVISESMAEKYFGQENPLGKILEISDSRFNQDQCVVTGVFEDFPENMHFKSDFLVSYSTLYQHLPMWGLTAYERYALNWNYNTYHTYIRLKPGADPVAIQAQFPALIDKYKPRLLKEDEQGNRLRIQSLKLKPLQAIHLSPDLLNELEAGGNPEVLYFLQIIGLFILILALANYVNLSTSKAIDRAREVGIRKVVGSQRRQLIQQFLMESLLINVLAIASALILVEICLPFFGQLIGKNIPFSLLQHPLFGIGIITGLFLLTLLSGLYPAFVLSAYRPVEVLKGQLVKGTQGLNLRHVLVTGQFAISVALIIGTFAVYQQLQYMRTRDLGFNKEQVLILERPSVLDTTQAVRAYRKSAFLKALQDFPAIEKISLSNRIPGQEGLRGLGTSSKLIDNDDVDNVKVIHHIRADRNFLETYEIDLLVGQNFATSYLDTGSVILTEKAAERLEFASPQAALGQMVYLYGSVPRKVIGVSKDYHLESLREEVLPALFVIDQGADQYYAIRLQSDAINSTLKYLEQQWKQAFPGNPFNYYFLDAYFDRLYQTDQQFGWVFGLFAGLAIFIACLGLLGLSSLMITQRTKEIGIRKVLGASVNQIIVLLSNDYIRLIFFAAAIAIPLTYLGVSRWLQDFAFHISLQWWLFALPLLLVIVLAWLTVGYQTVKTALANPVNSLRNE